MIIMRAVPERSLREKLGEQLRSARVKTGLSQAGLAEKLSISRPSIASIEAGRQSVAVEQLVDIAKLLDISAVEVLAHVLGGTGSVVRELDRLPEAHRVFIQKLKTSGAGR